MPFKLIYLYGAAIKNKARGKGSYWRNREKYYQQYELYFESRLMNTLSLTKRSSGCCVGDKKERGTLLANLTECHLSVYPSEGNSTLTLSGPDSNGQTEADPYECSDGQMAFPCCG